MKTLTTITLAILLGLTWLTNTYSQTYRFQNPALSLNQRINNLDSVLSVDEKLSLLNQIQPAISRLGIKYFTTWTEGLHGLGWAAGTSDSTTTWPQAGGNVFATTFPQAFGLAQTWDPELIQKVGATIGYEARVYFNRDSGKRVTLTVRTPMIDLGRDPRWGRTEESYGEDPYLVGEMGKGMVKGLQGNNSKYLLTASTLKHFMANNNEANRGTSSSNFDERDLREYYLVPFKKCLLEANAQSMMTSYNKINNTYALMSPIVRNIVVSEWKFDGMICTDAYAVWNVPNMTMQQIEAAAVKAGTNVFVDGDIANLKKAYTNGLFTKADIDTVLRGNLRMRMRLGHFDPAGTVPFDTIKGTEKPWLKAENKALARLVTQKSIVLLKNRDNALPLDSTKLQSIAVIGPNANDVYLDWYSGILPYKVSIVQGLKNKLGNKTTVQYAADNTNNAAVDLAKSSDVAIVCIGNNPLCNAGWATCTSAYEGKETKDRTYIELDPTQVSLVKAVFRANPKTIVVLVSSFPQSITWINDSIPAIMHIAHSSQEQGNAVADALLGDVNPGGRLSMTWYKATTDLPTMLDYNIRTGRTYMYYKGTPLYPFGYGLSYTTFKYSGLVTSAESMQKDGTVTVQCSVQNTGTRTGDEVVQLYVAQDSSRTSRPIKELKGFKRITLAPSESKDISFTLNASDVSIWNPDEKKFIVERGKLNIMVGGSSNDIQLTSSISVVSDDMVNASDTLTTTAKTDTVISIKDSITTTRKTIESYASAMLFKENGRIGLSILLQSAANVNLKIYDIRGICCGTISYSAPQGITILDLNGINLTPGIYILSGTIGEKPYYSKNVVY